MTCQHNEDRRSSLWSKPTIEQARRTNQVVLKKNERAQNRKNITNAHVVAAMDTGGGCPGR